MFMNKVQNKIYKGIFTLVFSFIFSNKRYSLLIAPIKRQTNGQNDIFSRFGLVCKTTKEILNPIRFSI